MTGVVERRLLHDPTPTTTPSTAHRATPWTTSLTITMVGPADAGLRDFQP